MTDSSWPKGTGSQAAAPPPMAPWERPNPPHLNDTSAIVRKGTYPWQLETRLGCKSECEMPFNAENTFNRNSPTVGICGPYGAGGVVAVRTPYKSNGGRRPDGNGSVPNGGSTLAVGVAQIPPGK